MIGYAYRHYGLQGYHNCRLEHAGVAHTEAGIIGKDDSWEITSVFSDIGGSIETYHTVLATDTLRLWYCGIKECPICHHE